jgi:predicted transport protein
MEKGLLEKTGKSLDSWIKVVRQSKIEKHSEIINFLKAEHGLTYGFANFVALKAKKSDAASIADTDLLSSQYKGKEELKLIYEKLVAEIKKFGSDITITPKKDSVSIIRKKQFVLIKPATKTRIDLGLKFKDKPTTKRLQDSGPFGSMCSHRVVLSSATEVDTELSGWLKEAYHNAK